MDDLVTPYSIINYTQHKIRIIRGGIRDTVHHASSQNRESQALLRQTHQSGAEVMFQTNESSRYPNKS